MKTEPATILVIVLGGFSFFFLLLPLAIVLTRLMSIWRADRGAGALMFGIVFFTAVFFLLFFVGLAVLTFSGGLPE